MLVLTRKRDQKITIGKNIIVTILKIQGDKVSIGIEADRDTPVYRSELLARENPRKKEDISHMLDDLSSNDLSIETLQIDLEKEKQHITLSTLSDSP